MIYSKTNLPESLNHNNKIVFHINERTYEGKVVLNHTRGFVNFSGDNEVVFREAGLNTNTDKREFCAIIYGTDTANGDWPETGFDSEEKNHNALLRIVLLALHEDKLKEAVKEFKADKEKFKKDFQVNFEAEIKKSKEEYDRKLAALTEKDKELIEFFNTTPFSSDYRSDILELTSVLTKCPLKTFLK